MNDSSQDRISIHSEDSNNSTSNGDRSSSVSQSDSSKKKILSSMDFPGYTQSSDSFYADDDSVPKTEKELKMLSFVNPGKFLDDFDPERSTRELRKMQRKLKPSTKPNSLYDEAGRIRETGVDICDCLDHDCPGCHFPCAKCASEKCGTECRCNRKWHYDSIYVEGTEINIKFK